MLFLTIDGRKPGSILRFPEGTNVRLVADVQVRSPQYPVRYLDLIVNGEIVERRFDPNGRTDWSLRHLLPLRGSCWIAARAHSDAGTDAHTNPIYVYRGQRHPFNPTSARRIIARLDGSMAAIPLPEVRARLEALKTELNNLIRDPLRTTLPLPTIGN
jgi:hypothetical protein